MITKTNYPYIFLVALIMSNPLAYGMYGGKQPSATDNLNYEDAQLKVFNDSLKTGNIDAAQYAINSLKSLQSRKTNIQDLERQLKDYKTQKSQKDKEKIINDFNKALTDKQWGIAERILVTLAPEYEYLKDGLRAKYDQAKASAGQVAKLKAGNPMMQTGALRQNIKVQKDIANRLPRKID